MKINAKKKKIMAIAKKGKKKKESKDTNQRN